VQGVMLMKIEPERRKPDAKIVELMPVMSIKSKSTEKIDLEPGLMIRQI